MSPTRVSVMLNHPPHCCTLRIDPAEVTIANFLREASARMGAAMQSRLPQVKLCWIEDEKSAFPSNSVDEAEAWNDWYSTTGLRLASIPIDTDQKLRKKLRDIENANLVQLYVIAPPTARMAYRRVLWGGSDDVIRTTMYNPSPSQAVRDRQAHKVAQNKAPIYDGRQPLADDLGPHAGIYHKFFAEMYHAIDSERVAQVKLDNDMEDIVRELCDGLASKDVYDEDSCLDKLEKSFQKLFRGCRVTFHKKYRLWRGHKLDVELDFVVTCPTPYGVDAVILAGEAKYREGNGGSGPTQAVYGYRRVIIHPTSEPIFFSSSCPCIILAMTGQAAHLDAAYFTDAVYCTEMGLLSLSLKHGVKESRNLTLPCQFQVIRNTVKKLARFYGEIHTGISYNLDFLLPDPCVVSEDGNAQSILPQIPDVTALKFEKRLFTTGGRGIFEGTITYQAPVAPSLSIDNADAVVPTVAVQQDVYIKFVDRYGEPAHRLLSEAGLAPKLWWCGPVSGYASTMVLMDKLVGNTVQDFLEKGFAVTHGDLKRLDKALALLLKDRLVHGDLRPPNVILCPPSEPGQPHDAYLIDFDWAGKEGEVKYPSNLNPVILWPPRVKEQPYAPILCSDDEWMRQHLNVQSTAPISPDQFPWMQSPDSAGEKPSSGLALSRTAGKRPHEDEPEPEGQGLHPHDGLSIPAPKRSRESLVSSLMLPLDSAPTMPRRTPSRTQSQKSSSSHARRS